MFVTRDTETGLPPIRVVALLALLALFTCQGGRGLWDSNEARVAGIAGEMADSGDFVVPTLNGRPFLEKPPLHYALASIPLRWIDRFGIGWARSVSGLSSLAVLAIAYLFSLRAFGKRTAILSSLFLLANYEFQNYGHTLDLDVTLCVFTTGALAAFWEWNQHAPNTRIGRRWAGLIGACLSLAFLTKNLVGIALPCSAMLSYLALRRDGRRLRALILGPASAVGLAGTGAYLLLLYRRVGADGLGVLLWNNTVTRFVDASELGHPWPFWFYAIGIWSLVTPWAIFFALMVVDALRRRAYRELRNAHPPTLFCVCCVAAPFLLLSMASCKRVVYGFPMVPFTMILLGDWFLTVMKSEGTRRWNLLLTFHVIAFLAAGTWVVGRDYVLGSADGMMIAVALTAISIPALWTLHAIRSGVPLAVFVPTIVFGIVAATAHHASPSFLDENRERSLDEMVRWTLEASGSRPLRGFHVGTERYLGAFSFARREPLEIADDAPDLLAMLAPIVAHEDVALLCDGRWEKVFSKVRESGDPRASFVMQRIRSLPQRRYEYDDGKCVVIVDWPAGELPAFDGPERADE